MKDHAALMIRKDDKFLFIRRSKNKKTLPNIWAVPSGTKEEEEEIYQTVVREAKEELGIEVQPEKTLTTMELPEFNVRLYFVVCTIFSGTPTIKDYDEIEEIEWLTLSEFFNKYDDSKIGHGLVFLRKNLDLFKDLDNFLDKKIR